MTFFRPFNFPGDIRRPRADAQKDVDSLTLTKNFCCCYRRMRDDEYEKFNRCVWLMTSAFHSTLKFLHLLFPYKDCGITGNGLQQNR